VQIETVIVYNWVVAKPPGQECHERNNPATRCRVWSF
jgi:hypothetical protein